MIPVKLKKVHPDAITPAYGTSRASGADLYALEDTLIKPGETKLVRTGIALCMPSPEPDEVVAEVQIRDRSGLAFKTKLRVANSPGTIDEDYLGELKVIIDNITPPLVIPYIVQDGPHYKPEIREVHVNHVLATDGTTLYSETEYPIGTYLIRKGDRIAQAVFTASAQMEFIEVQEFDQATERGEGGFGSTGIK